MFHSFSIDHSAPGAAKGAMAHATTFYAAVHGFGSVKETRAQRRKLMAKLEADAPGSSKPPPRLGPRLKVPSGPSWNNELRKYTFLFPGSDAAVVRTSQRILARLPRKAGEPYLTPQFGASVCVNSTFWAAMMATMGLLFNLLASLGPLGRSILLRHPRLFTLGAFSDEGPTEEMLAATSWTTTFFGKGWAKAQVDAGTDTPTPPGGQLDTTVVVKVSGPEPGYIATARMFAMMGRTILDDRAELTAHAPGGVYTPGALLGGGGTATISRVVERLREVGVVFETGELTPVPSQGGEKRPAWQSALNLVALLGWAGVLATLILDWQNAVPSANSPLLRATIGLEAICAFETFQIALGIAQGNLPMGIVLHYTRLLIALVAMPLASSSLSSRLVLLAWSATEVCRYPMFLLPSSSLARLTRYVVPALTFPLGVVAEASLAYSVTLLLGSSASLWTRAALLLVVPTNLLLGFGLGYPQVLRKARNMLRPAKKTN